MVQVEAMNTYRRNLLAIAGVVLLVVLAACGSSGSITQTAQTEHYTVQLSIEGMGLGERTATIEIHDASGQPVAADRVVLAPVMQQMGMASPETTAQPLAPGRYQATGDFFSMLGEWDVDVQVQRSGAEEIASFKVQVTQ